MTTTIPEACLIDFARPLGGLEHLFSLIDRHRTVHFAMAAQIEGPTSIPAWRAALDKLQERHSLLSVAIVINDSSAPHFRAVRNAPIPLRVTVGPTVSSWQTEIARELAVPFDAQQAPLARAVLMHGQCESVFILTTHHSIADGLSSAYAIRDLMRLLARENLEPLLPIPALESLVYRSQQAHNDTEDLGLPEVPQENQAVTFRTVDGSLPNIQALQLSPVRTRTLVERARKERTTVHGALCAALVVAGRESSTSWNASPVRVMSPFSLRNELGIGEDCGLFVWAGSVSMSPRTSTDFWEVARFAKSSLTKKQSLGRVSMELQGLEQAVNSGIDVSGAAQVFAQVLPFELLLTNLGKLSVQFDTGSLRLKALWGPSLLMGFENEQTVGVTTTNDSLCLLHTTFTPIPSLLPRASEILQRACE
jgi:hypothetical protein